MKSKTRPRVRAKSTPAEGTAESHTVSERTLLSLAPGFNERTEANVGKELLGLDSGFPELNRITAGLRGTMILSGPPGSGKSTLLAQMAWHDVAQCGGSALYVSAEMDTDAIIRHFASVATGCSREAIQRGRLYEEEQKATRKIWDDLVKAHGARLVVLDDADLSLDRLVETAWALKDASAGSPPLVILDSLHAATHVMGARGSGDTERDSLDRLCIKLRAAAKEVGFTLIAAAHVTKATAQHGKQFASAGSASIDFLADVVAAICVEPAAREDDPEHIPTVLRLTKNRHGPLGQIKLLHLPLKSRFEEVE